VRCNDRLDGGRLKSGGYGNSNGERKILDKILVIRPQNVNLLPGVSHSSSKFLYTFYLVMINIAPL